MCWFGSCFIYFKTESHHDADLLSLAALEVVKMTTSCAISNEKVDHDDFWSYYYLKARNIFWCWNFQDSFIDSGVQIPKFSHGSFGTSWWHHWHGSVFCITGPLLDISYYMFTISYASSDQKSISVTLISFVVPEKLPLLIIWCLISLLLLAFLSDPPSLDVVVFTIYDCHGWGKVREKLRNFFSQLCGNPYRSCIRNGLSWTNCVKFSQPSDTLMCTWTKLLLVYVKASYCCISL